MITDMGISKAANDPILRTALNTYQGKIVHPALSAAMTSNKKG
jgi:alanine dehydrogenase